MTMQADELRDLRRAAGFTQSELADAIGMSTRMVNKMEAGEAAIERRTEMAVHYVATLANSHTMFALALKMERAARGEASLDPEDMEDAATWLKAAASLPRDWAGPDLPSNG
jgi:transcriptional regulator with XRE-family HTH domain